MAASVELDHLRQLENESVLQCFKRFDALVEIAYGEEQTTRLRAVFLMDYGPGLWQDTYRDRDRRQ